MDAAVIIQLAAGVGLQNTLGLFAPILSGFVSIIHVVGMIATLWFYSDNTAQFNQQLHSINAQAHGSELKYDVIVVGGGSAGSVVATRLSKHFSVLLLERGGEPNPLTTVPGLQGLMLTNPEVDYMYMTVPQNSSCLAMNNQQCQWNAGRGLGGGSMVNSLVYIRGHPFDYNRWSEVTGDERWRYENILPFFLRSEGLCNHCETTHSVPPITNPEYHSSNGELSVRPIPFTPLVPEFLEAANWAGIPRGDLNAPYFTSTADTNWYTQRNGRRASTYHSFLAPVLDKRPSLRVEKYARVIQVLFEPDTNQAIGVKYEQYGKHHVAKANKEVILSAGSIGTPKILLLSGIGPESECNRFKIPVRSNIPVGRNLQDHVATLLGPFLIDEPASLLPDRDNNAEAANAFLSNGTGPFTNTWVRATTMWTSTRAASEGESKWPDIAIHLVPNGVYETYDNDLSRIYNIKPDIVKEYLDPVKGRDAFNFIVDFARPKSRGSVTLKSSNYEDEPVIDPRYFHDPQDIRVTVEAVQRLVYFAENAPSFKRLGARLSPVPFPPCKHYVFRSTGYWECFVTHLSLTLHHFSGTAAMGGRDSPGAVVDSELRVRGVKGLRVMDASVMPFIVSTNTNAPTIMIAERGAEFVMQEHRKAQLY